MNTIFTFLTNNKNKTILAFAPMEIMESKDLSALSDFLTKWKNDYCFGFLSYDFKNEIYPNLISKNQDRIGFPTFGFFIPKYVVEWDSEGEKVYLKGEENRESQEFIHDFFREENEIPNNKIELIPEISKSEYLSKIKAIQQEISKGTFEEINFCHQFYSENSRISPFSTFFELNRRAKAPFSCFLKWNDNYLLSASPERFIQKVGDKLITQPIKGTAKRGKNKEEDELLKKQLIESKKERNENVLTVRLIEKELEQIAVENSVKIEELCQIYTFETVHQLISTLSARIKSNTDFISLLKVLFPMGSMTGNPKYTALEFIDKIESFQRGLYSGSVGYFEPNGNFDFNVVIRSILYNEKTKSISCSVGGAITEASIPENEYEECLVKLELLKSILNDGK